MLSGYFIDRYANGFYLPVMRVDGEQGKAIEQEKSEPHSLM